MVPLVSGDSVTFGGPRLVAIVTETLVTGGTAAVLVSQNAPCALYAVRVGGTANLAGTVTIANGTTTRETIPIGAVPGTERQHFKAIFPDGLRITLSNAGDTAIVIWEAA